MASSQKSGVIQRLRRAVLLQDGAARTDGQLLEDYISRRDEAALAALVFRHGPMVWGVCRRVLSNYHDAEDAFQATFLVLVRKASSIASRELLANWLYGVAYQTGLKARATAAKRKGRETQVKDMPDSAVIQQAVWHDLQPLLDEELSRLSDKYRAVIVLCDLEGKTRKEAAELIGCPEGTVAGRLARARVMLAKRLAHRGVTLSGGALAVVLAEKVASAGVPTSIVSSTIKAASLFAAAQTAGVISARVAALTEGVVKAMFPTKIKCVLMAVLVLTVFTGGAGLLYQTQAAEPPKGAPKKDGNKPMPTEPTPPPAKTDQERIVGYWVIVNEDSKRKGEAWNITKDRILKNPQPNFYYPPVFLNYHLDPGKDPKQIDIGATKGIYVLDGDELRLCMGGTDKDRPAAFPKKPAPGEVLILQRQKADAEQPKAKEAQPDKTDRERMVGNWFIMNEDSMRKGEMWVITEDSILMHAKDLGLNIHHYAHRLDTSRNPKEIDITVTRGSLVIGIIKGIYALDGEELRLYLAELNKDRPAEFPKNRWPVDRRPSELLILHRATSGATPPKPKEPKPAQTDHERIVGSWFIVNEDSGRKGQFWLIDKDRILMDPQNSSPIIQTYSHKLDASKNPKQIDITVARIKGPTVGVIKGIYVLGEDGLWLCLGELGKDRPAAFPERPMPGEVLILQRVRSGATPPTTKDGKPEQKVLTPEEAIKQKQKAEEAIKQSQEKVTVKFKVTSVQVVQISKSSVVGEVAGFDEGLILKDGDRFVVQLYPPVMETIRRLGIEPEQHFKGKVVQVTGVLQPGQPAFGTGEFQIVVNDLSQFAVVAK